MTIDAYAPCPGGTGKKIKFCCPDLQAELDKIHRMLEGEQRAACLELIESLEAKTPDRACLLSMKAMLEAQLGNETKAEETVKRFIEKHPENPVALAEQATFRATQGEPITAVNLLQDALEHSPDQVPPALYDALGMVAQSLLVDNQLLAARGHLTLQITLSGAKDQRPLQLLMRLNTSPSVPLVAKQDFPLGVAPDDVLWKNSYLEAVSPAARGEWRLAAKNLVELAAKVGDWPAIWHDIAVLRSWLADTTGAIEAWRKYATQPIPLDDAVEAEALAQLLDSDTIDMIDHITVEYGVNDVEACLARLAASPRTPNMPVDLSRLGTPEEPPPKGAWWLVDRDIPASGVNIKLEEIPRIVGHVFLFGKQTDRAARLELIAFRPELAEGQAVVKEVVGDALGTAGPEVVAEQAPAVQQMLSWNWRLPDDTPPAKRLELINDQRAEILLNRWPELPQKVLDGKSAVQAAADPALRAKVLATLLVLELATDQSSTEFDFNTLRKKLGLPPLEPVDPTTTSAIALPLVRLSRVDAKKLNDEELLRLYQMADHFRHVAALRKLAAEVIARSTLDKQLDKAEVYGILAQIEPDTDKAVDYLDLARKTAEANKTSTAPWDLAELGMRLARGEVAEADRLLHHIRNDHIREPGVAQALFQILSQAGIIGPDGRPTAAAAAGREGAGIVVPGAAAAEPGKIWTPGGEQPSGGKKSALWTPDMD